MFRIAISDDQPVILKQIENIVISELDKANIKCDISLFDCGRSVLNYDEIKDFDVIFLD